MLRARTWFTDSTRRRFGLRCRSPRVAWLACLALTAGIAGRARAEDDILKLVPEQALGFVVISRPAAADAKLQQLGQQMKLPVPSLLAKLQGPNGIRKGLDKNRPMALLVLPPKTDNSLPVMIALVPVTDYAEFLDEFKSEDTEGGVTKIQIWGTPSVVRKIGGYAAISESSSREALDLKLADEVPATLAPWRTWLAKQDAAMVVLAPGIHLLSAKVQQGVAAIKPLLAQTGKQAKQAVAAFDMYVTFFQAAEKEVDAFGLGVERDAQGVVRLSKRARLVHGGDLGRVLRGAVETVETQRPGGAARRALRLSRRRTALPGRDAEDDDFLFRHDQEHARRVRAERGTGRDVLRVRQNGVPGGPRHVLRARRGARARNRSCRGCSPSCGSTIARSSWPTMKSSPSGTTGLSRRSTARCSSRCRSRRPKLTGAPR